MAEDWDEPDGFKQKLYRSSPFSNPLLSSSILLPPMTSRLSFFDVPPSSRLFPCSLPPFLLSCLLSAHFLCCRFPHLPLLVLPSPVSP